MMKFLQSQFSQMAVVPWMGNGLALLHGLDGAS